MSNKKFARDVERPRKFITEIDGDAARLAVGVDGDEEHVGFGGGHDTDPKTSGWSQLLLAAGDIACHRGDRDHHGREEYAAE